MRHALYVFGIMNEADIEWLMDAGQRQSLAAGTVLVREGQPLDMLYIVLQGQLRVSIAVEGGMELSRLQAGEVVGEISFVDSRPPTATVTASEDALVLAISRQHLAAKLAHDEGFAARFYQALSVLLADRMRGMVRHLGYRHPDAPGDEAADDDELDPQVLQRMALAGARFDWMLKRLQGT